ncbi:MAG: glycosyltransferase [Bacteroidota bacterium]
MIDVLVVSHATFRGVNRNVFNYLKQEYGYSVEIIAPKQLSFSGKILNADPPQNPEEKIHFLDLKGQNPRMYDFEGLYELADQLQPRIIYLENDPVSNQAIKLGRWCKKNKAHLICLSCENLRFDPISSLKRSGFKGFLLGFVKLGLLYASRPTVDQVFTINDAGTKIFSGYKFKKVVKTPLGFNPDLFYPSPERRAAARKELGLGDLFTLAYIGRLVPEKGVDMLLQSLKRIEHLSWVFIIDKFEASPGTYQARIFEQIEALGLSARVKYFDAGHSEIGTYMNAADLVVIPSVSTPFWVEQYGRVAPESMACGKLVLTSDSGALPELVGDAGVIFKEGNLDDLTEKLTQIIQNPGQFQPIAEKAHTRAHTFFSLKSQAKLIHESIQSFL